MTTKLMTWSRSNTKRKFTSDKCLHLKEEKFKIKFATPRTKKIEQNKPKLIRRKEILNIITERK